MMQCHKKGRSSFSCSAVVSGGRWTQGKYGNICVWNIARYSSACREVNSLELDDIPTEDVDDAVTVPVVNEGAAEP